MRQWHAMGYCYDEETEEPCPLCMHQINFEDAGYWNEWMERCPFHGTVWREYRESLQRYAKEGGDYPIPSSAVDALAALLGESAPERVPVAPTQQQEGVVS